MKRFLGVLIVFLVSCSFAIAQVTGDESDIPSAPIKSSEELTQRLQASAESKQPMPPTKTQAPISTNVGSAKLQLPSGSTVSADGKGSSSFSAGSVESGGTKMGGGRDVTVSPRKVTAKSVDVFTFGSSSGEASFSNVKDAEVDSHDNVRFRESESGSFGGASLNGIKDFSGSKEAAKIGSLGNFWSEPIRGDDWSGVTITPLGIAVNRGTLVDFFRALANDVRFFDASIPSQRFTLKQSSSLSSGPILLENLKDASVKVGSQLVVESNDTLDLIAGKQRSTITPINNLLRISGSTDESQNPKIRVESANITTVTGEAKEIAIVPRSVILTTDPSNGITCLDLDANASYLYQTPRIQSSFQLQNPDQHTLCIKRSLNQQIKECSQCSTLDLTTDELRSSGTLQYHRFYFDEEFINTEFAPFVLPMIPSRYGVSWDGDAYRLKSTSEDMFMRINSLISIHDKRDNGKTHRYILFQESPSTPLPTSIRSEFPEATTKNDVLIQPTLQGTSIRVSLR